MKNVHYSKKKKCKDCSRLITNNAIRCCRCSKKQHWKRKAYQKQFIGQVAPNFKHGKYINNHCIDCGKKVGALYKRCKSCSKKGRLSSRFGKPPYHGNGAYYKGNYMRSSWEIAFAYFLDLSGIKWFYEPKRFYFKDCTYLPDFYLPEWDLYIEIKGWFHKNTKKRFNLFKKKYSNIKLLMKRDLQEIGIL